MKNKIGEKLENLPETPGIYQFKDRSGKVIYVGKAKSLKSRVRSYFISRPLGPRIERMVSLIRDVDVIQTDSEAESLILEMNLVKELKPRYNVNLKDDKSFPYIIVTNEPFPRVFPTRKRKSDGSRYFGPYTDVGSMRYSLKMLRDIFMIRTCSYNITAETIKKKRYKLCLEYHINKCEGPCEGLVTEKHYREMIDEAVKVLNGKTSTLIRELKEKMEAASGNEKFEEAAVLRNKIGSLEVYASKQKVVSEDFLDRDIINFAKEGDEACAMVLNVRDGKLIGKRHFFLERVEDKSETEMLESVIFRYYSENGFIPDEIYLPAEMGTSPGDMDAVKEWFKGRQTKKVVFVIPKKGEKLKLLSMVKTNAKYMLDDLKLQRLKREFVPNSVIALGKDLRLAKPPRRIECYDISNIQGTDTVASMVVFHDGRPKKSLYRKFKIESVLDETGMPDDFLSMREVIHRRFRRLIESKPNSLSFGEGRGEVWGEVPDLVVIDGGKGQLSSAVKVLNDLGLKLNGIIGLAKKLEEVYVPAAHEPLSIPKSSAGLRLLQRVRDEAHRFAVTYHRSLRDKRTLVSELESIKGIGKKTAQKLLSEFGSVEKIKEAIKTSFEEFEKKAGKKVAERVKAALKNN